MNYEPNNTTAQFVTKLTEVIELEGNWEVGLTEIMIPCTLQNVGGDGSFYYTLLFDAQPSIVRCEMSSGIYATNAEVMRELRRIGRLDNSQVINWEYLVSKKRVALKDVSGQGTTPMQLTMSEDLAAMIGFDANKRYFFSKRVKSHVGDKAPRLSAGFENVYVYCDVLEHVLVEDTKTPLLRIFHRKGSSYGTEHVVFNPVPVSYTHLTLPTIYSV